MSYCLKTDEILDLLEAEGHERHAELKQMLEDVTQEMANALAIKCGIMAHKTSAEGMAFAGTACTFFAIYPGQPLPASFVDHGFDSTDEWGTFD